MNYEPIPHGNGWKIGPDYYAVEDGWTQRTIEVLGRLYIKLEETKDNHENELENEYDRGVDAGYDDGYQDGESYGYQEGYNNARAEFEVKDDE